MTVFYAFVVENRPNRRCSQKFRVSETNPTPILTLNKELKDYHVSLRWFSH
jgi:hypothetical protein